MKKMIVVLLLACIILAGCKNNNSSGNAEHDTLGHLLPCDGGVLYYDENTKIVYYVNSDTKGYAGYGFMSPYISANGCFCRYIDGEIVEIQNNK